MVRISIILAQNRDSENTEARKPKQDTESILSEGLTRGRCLYILNPIEEECIPSLPRGVPVADVPDIIQKLVDQFHENRDQYLSAAYNEEQTRAEFINPFFEALGWDVTNKAGNSPAYMDVVFEGSLRVDEIANAPDYTFRVGPARKFFVEAKKPDVPINFHPDPARQIRRYSWTAKLPLGVLTNFHGFAVYDCRVPPKPSDQASHARLKYIKYTEYPQRWDEIASIFSKDAVWKGSFDKYAVTEKGKRGTAEVDQEFLKQIEEWRTILARNLALRNPQLGVRELNYAVQSTIDRIVFLRMCEDRGIEPQGQLLGRTSGPNIHGRLVDLYISADHKYNSGLFHFSEEKGRVELPDTFTPALKIDDKVLKDMIAGLYYPRSPYEFSVIGADILGSVYEQFLGKVIRLTPAHTAVVDEKPEVKKAGGVYYTPTYIVDYIVKNTVGKLCEGKTPKQVEKLRILDPACGSGSFLINAYALLLNWHLDYYVKNDPMKHKKEVYRISDSEWRLTTKEKKRILLNNIYGVDIDSQAVEVTKLSLLLKVLEGESRDTLDISLSMFHERALPDLANNIKCGNSLIGMDFDTTGLSEDEIRRINPFDWNRGFPAIMSRGGFDAVIGNPPYVRPHNLDPAAKRYFWKHYSTFLQKSDLYCCFIEKSICLLRNSGEFGYIVSDGWLRLDSFLRLREMLLGQTSISHIIDFTDNVFSNANVLASIVMFSKRKSSRQIVCTAVSRAGVDLNGLTLRPIPQEAFGLQYKCIFDLSLDERLEAIKEKMRQVGTPLGDAYGIAFGLKTADDEKFLTHSPTTPQHKPLLRGEDVHRYSLSFKGEYVWYVPDQMRAHRRTARPGTPERFEQPKVLMRDTGGGLSGTFDDGNYYVKDVLVLFDEKKDASALKYLTGVLNAKLLRFYYETSFPTLHLQRDELASLPIRILDLNDPADKARHDKIVELVNRILDLHKKLAAASIPGDKTAIERQIDATDDEIDNLVYELYGLTDEEIEIVKAAT